MDSIARKISFWQLLDDTNVVIPIIQRDYAQGRVGFENLREKFLGSLLTALKTGEQLKLDFVYGSTNHQHQFYPLDGQQRLTTLWLLHWYIAYRLNKLTDSSIIDRLLHFSYETRSSSKQFCERLVKYGSKLMPQNQETISDAIMRQTWFPSFWRQDPTIQAMLRMLSGEQDNKIDGIEELFKLNNDYLPKYWESLISNSNECPIVFYKLDLENIGQSDDLYIKMNGRGKPLTDYENFKADLVKYLIDQDWKELSDAENGLPILMDTTWTDFFWQYSQDGITLDDMMFGFINRYFLVQMLQLKILEKIEDKDLGNDRLSKTFKYLYSYTESKDKRESYRKTGFAVYQRLFEHEINAEKIGNKLLTNLKTILNNLSLFNKDELTECIKYMYSPNDDDKFELIYKGKDFYKLTIPETIAFWGVCQFFASNKIEATPHTLNNLKHWMRIVWNVSKFSVLSNASIADEIRNKTALRSTIIALEQAFQDKCDVYNLEKINSDAIDNSHILEEYAKIQQINKRNYQGKLSNLIGKTWEDIILELEKLPFFQGTIAALMRGEDETLNWSCFDIKYQNLYWYLNNYKHDLTDIAYRNYLLYDFASIKRYYWFQSGDVHNALWRLILSHPSIVHNVHTWLINQPLNEEQLSNKDLRNKSYCERVIIKTGFINEVNSERGMYLAYSWKFTCDVYIHHQASNRPYVIFNEDRDNILNDAIDNNIITLHDQTCRKECGTFDSRDIIFIYKNEEYNWHSTGVIYKQSNPNKSLPQPNSLASFVNIMILLNI